MFGGRIRSYPLCRITENTPVSWLPRARVRLLPRSTPERTKIQVRENTADPHGNKVHTTDLDAGNPNMCSVSRAAAKNHGSARQ